ncbi:hypothetical protein W02_11630 [Nitrospira sp. KM1]|uniref:DUF748 domain-containing protein n=1 Tax=Nitrospira sp. KM1 TaxID=1936990 RepID=UPI0013A7913B|nr:DUF748 domain-containing protein [Nitrospira sp. KM1]BCA54023.1 hypothetical protein W02_11630 [Nitrospira sp. KM1]
MKRRWWLLLVLTAGLFVIATIALFYIDEPLRVYAERQFNQNVDGYTLSIGRLRFHPIGLSVDFEESTLIQNDHPEPPVATIPRWHASIHWQAILNGRLVSDHYIDRPVLRITQTQAAKEAKDDKGLAERGWQQAILSVYPLKIDVFQLHEADLTYADNPKSKPLHLSRLNVTAENIRNVRSRERTYPSTVHVDGEVFDSGNLVVDGSADFLSEPHFGADVDVSLQSIHLDDVVPLTGRFNVQLRKGTVSGKGHLEYSPHIKQARVLDLELEGVRVDYVHARSTARSELHVAEKTVETAKRLNNHPEWLIRLDRAVLRNSEMGFVNQAVDPAYRVFLSEVDLNLENFSNQFSEGTAHLQLTGKFMGTGQTEAHATFRPETHSPDFEIQVKMVKTKMRSMNDLLRSYSNFDVADGFFSFFSELKVKDGTIAGYVKPLFKDVSVYDPDQDKDKSLLQKLYEAVVGGTLELLANRDRKEVATQADVSGKIQRPETSTLQVVLKLIQNAFFKAILPGFEQEAKRAG